jgi:uncharacterized protein YlxW (UPF0749 family)
LLVACLALGFLLATAVQSEPASLEQRLPSRYRLADLIERQRSANEELSEDVAALRAEFQELRSASEDHTVQTDERDAILYAVGLAAGRVPVEGPGLKVTLDDSRSGRAPSGNINDLVIHSQDVQAVVNALWRSGAEAIAINGQRLVSTSAVLCVGNTLLLNGTVHSPPYEVTAVAASRERFDSDPLVERLREDADVYGLGFTVERVNTAQVPAYAGNIVFRFAEPAV